MISHSPLRIGGLSNWRGTAYQLELVRGVVKFLKFYLYLYL